MRLRTIIFTRLLFLLLVLVAGATSVWAQTTYHLEKVTTVEAGGLYVFEQSGRVMSNALSNKAIQTITSYKNEALNGTESYVWTLEAVSGGGFKMKNVSLSSKAYLTNTSSTDVSFDTKTNGSTWVFNFQEDETVLIQNKSYENRFLGFDFYKNIKAYATSNLSTVDHAIVVYQLVEDPTTATITLNAACNDGSRVYGTYSNSRAFVVSNDIVVSEISVTDGCLAVSSYETGDIVPANTGVMVSASTGGDYTVQLATGGTSVLGDDNMLKASGDNGITADDMNAANTKFYRLTMHNGTQIGYWWGAAEGAAFDLAANKAYLAVPTAAGARIQSLWFDSETTGVSDVRSKMKDGRGEVFDLQGHRVVQPIKGMYIVDSKKVVIK